MHKIYHYVYVFSSYMRQIHIHTHTFTNHDQFCTVITFIITLNYGNLYIYFKFYVERKYV